VFLYERVNLFITNSHSQPWMKTAISREDNNEGFDRGNHSYKARKAAMKAAVSDKGCGGSRLRNSGGNYLGF